MPKKKIKINPRRDGFVQRITLPVQKAAGDTVQFAENMKKKPSKRNPVYKPLDKYWPDL